MDFRRKKSIKVKVVKQNNGKLSLMTLNGTGTFCYQRDLVH